MGNILNNMQAPITELSNKTGEVEILLDEVSRLTEEKVQLIEKHDKQILSKEKYIKQLKEEIWDHCINLNLLKSTIQSYEHQIIPKLQQRLFDLQNHMKVFKNRILDLIDGEDPEQSVDGKELLECLKKLDTNRKDSSFYQENNSSQKISFEYLSITQRTLDVQSLESALSTLQKMYKDKIKENRSIQEEISILYNNHKTHQQKSKQQITNLSAQIKLLKEHIIHYERDQIRLRKQYNQIDKILNESQKSKSKLSEEIASNVQKAQKQYKKSFQAMSTAEIIRIIGALMARIELLQSQKTKLSGQLYLSKQKHVQQVQKIGRDAAKVRQQSQAEVMRKQKEINDLKIKLHRFQ